MKVQPQNLDRLVLEASVSRLEAIALRLEATAIWLEAIPISIKIRLFFSNPQKATRRSKDATRRTPYY